MPSPATPRSSDHTATRLRDGRVLVVGGLAPGDYTKAVLTAADLYDPATDRWAPTGSMANPRQYHQATLMADGRVLVTGGYYEQKLPVAVEIFDPATGTWSPTADMPFGRMAHTTTLLPDGKVLVAGGLVVGPDARFTFSDSALLYDPVSGTWAATAELLAARAEHTATLLADGSVLVAGGHGSAGRIVAALRDALLYTPATGQWATVPHLMATGRAAHTATLFEDGSVLIVGGSREKLHGGTGRPTSMVELYEPKDGRFVPAPPLRSARLAHSATLLPDSRLLVVGGLVAEDDRRRVHAVGSAELYDPAGRRWSAAAPPLEPPSATANREMRVWLLAGNHSATLLAGQGCGAHCGQVLVVGGDVPTTSAQLYSAPVSAPTPRDKEAASGDDKGSGRALPVLAVALVVALVLGFLLAGRAKRARSPAGGRPPRR